MPSRVRPSCFEMVLEKAVAKQDFVGRANDHASTGPLLGAIQVAYLLPPIWR